jgi:membrane fusion protein, multidrug efflux system
MRKSTTLRNPWKQWLRWLPAFTALAGLLALSLAGASAMAEELKARGVVKSLASATISVEYPVRIKELPVLEGEAFSQGDILARFDCARHTAEIAAAAANARAADLVYTNNRRLLSKGAIGANEVRVSLAQAEKARSEQDALRARASACEYRAPFSGRMVERVAQEQEMPAASQPLMKIIDTNRMEVEAIVPSIWLRWLKSGEPVSFSIDETGTVEVGEVMRIGAAIDPVSQTVKVYCVLKQQNASVLPGMSGTAAFTHPGS